MPRGGLPPLPSQAGRRLSYLLSHGQQLWGLAHKVPQCAQQFRPGTTQCGLAISSSHTCGDYCLFGVRHEGGPSRRTERQASSQPRRPPPDFQSHCCPIAPTRKLRPRECKGLPWGAQQSQAVHCWLKSRDWESAEEGRGVEGQGLELRLAWKDVSAVGGWVASKTNAICFPAALRPPG